MNRLKKMTLTLVAGMMLSAVPAALAQQETSPDQFLGADEISAQASQTVQKAKLDSSKLAKTQKRKVSAAHKSSSKRNVLVAKK